MTELEGFEVISEEKAQVLLFGSWDVLRVECLNSQIVVRQRKPAVHLQIGQNSVRPFYFFAQSHIGREQLLRAIKNDQLYLMCLHLPDNTTEWVNTTWAVHDVEKFMELYDELLEFFA